MRTPTARGPHAVALLGALTFGALALSGCAPDPNGPAVSGPAIEDPRPADPGAEPGTGGAPLSEACEAAFPDSPFGTDIAAAPTVPASWAAPAGVELCTVFQSSDTTAVLQYATSLEPDAVLDAWEPLLGGYAVTRAENAVGSPILNATVGELELTIQPYDDLGYVTVGFQEGVA